MMHAQADSGKKDPTKFSERYLTHAQYDRASSSHAFDNAQVQSIHRPLYLSLASCPGPGFAHQPQEEEGSQEVDRKYFLFSAAEPGCLESVKKHVLDEKIDPASICDRTYYSATDFAEKGTKELYKTVACRNVVEWLKTRIRIHSETRFLKKSSKQNNKIQKVDSEPVGVYSCENSHRRPHLLQQDVQATVVTSATDSVPNLYPQYIATMCPGPDLAHRPTQKSAKKGERKCFLFAAAEAGCLQCVKHLVLNENIDPKAISNGSKYSVIAFAEWGAREQSKTIRCLEVAEC